MAYIKMFFALDDSQVSEQGVFTNAIEFTLRADLEETDEVRLYLLADDGYACTGVEVTPTGTTYLKWALAPDNAGVPGGYEAYGDPLSIGAVGDTTKIYFWAKAKATSDEDPVNDTTVTLNVSGVAAAE